MAKPETLTGLWQVSGRNDVNYDTRDIFDSQYVKNWTLWNDIAILFKTVKVVFTATVRINFILYLAGDVSIIVMFRLR